MQAHGWERSSSTSPNPLFASKTLSLADTLKKANILVVGLSGKIGSGKTTLSTELVKKLGRTRCIERNFADLLKEQVASHLNIPVEWCYTHEGKNTVIPEYSGKTLGGILQDWGTGLRETVHPNIWVNGIGSWLLSLTQSLSVIKGESLPNTTTINVVGYRRIVIIGDVRFPNEVQFIRETAGGVVLRLVGDPGGVHKETLRNTEHISETALDGDGFTFDYILQTNLLSVAEMTAAMYQFLRRQWSDHCAQRRFKAKRMIQTRISPLVEAIIQRRSQTNNAPIENIAETFKNEFANAFVLHGTNENENENVLSQIEKERIEQKLAAFALCASKETMTVDSLADTAVSFTE